MSSINYEQSLTFKRPLDFVFHYLADFSNTSEWDPSVLQATKTTPGPVHVGTHFDILLRFGPKELTLDYHVTALNRPYYIELKGIADSFSVIDRIRLEGDETQCKLDYQVEVYYQEPLSKLSAVLGPIVKQNAKRALQHLQKSLDQAPSDWHPSLWTRLGDRLVLPGMLNFTRRGYANNKGRWAGVTEDLSDKNILITGPTSGIGAAAARQLAKLGANLIFVARNEKKAQQIAEILETETGKFPQIEIADMSVVRDVDALCKRLLDKGQPLHVLINNAGNLFNKRTVTQEGLELSFATLLLGPYILTERLYPLLKKAAPSRVINVSTGGIYTQGLALDDMEYEKEDYNGSKAYARAKRGLVDMSELWAKRWKEEGITVHSMHPGWSDTPAVAHSLPRFYELTKPWLRTPDQGASTIVWLAAAKEATETSGLFWLDRTPHTTVMLPGTKSGPQQKEILAQKLAEYYARIAGDEKLSD